ncbi:cation diffusion facilitator family transporter [Streptomyces sp. NPDC096030]|uniref:cation diffusion facilitator family transporter n=1 Tax=Streptomyces sp. NPDC096030 TaxID=3155423 RepID=UPI003331FEA2
MPRAASALAVPAPQPDTQDRGSRTDPSREGLRTLWVSFAVLAATMLVQAVTAAATGSAALWCDSLHNAADALTAIPLAIAFVIGRREADRRHTYGYGRAEDLAGLAIVHIIALSSAMAAYETSRQLLSPREVTHLWAVAGGAVLGAAANEWVARYRIRTGRKIGSAALVADGLHARADGFASLTVLLGAAAAALGWPIADTLVGLLITAAILKALWDALREVCPRLMDAADPALVERAETALQAVDGVLAGRVRMRWMGHELRAEADIAVDQQLTVAQARQLAAAGEQALLHAVPQLAAASVHSGPAPADGVSAT